MFESDDLRGLLLSLTWVKSLAIRDVMRACLYSDESHFPNPLHSSCTGATVLCLKKEGEFQS